MYIYTYIYVYVYIYTYIYIYKRTAKPCGVFRTVVAETMFWPCWYFGWCWPNVFLAKCLWSLACQFQFLRLGGEHETLVAALPVEETYWRNLIAPLMFLCAPCRGEPS